MAVNRAEREPSGKRSSGKKKPVRKPVRKIVKVTLYRILIGPEVDPSTIELTNPTLKRAWILDQDLPLPDGHSLQSFTKAMAGPGLYRIEKKDANNNPVEVVPLIIDSILADRQRGRGVSEPEIEDEPEMEDRNEPIYDLPRPGRFRYVPRSRRRRDVVAMNPAPAPPLDPLAQIERWERIRAGLVPPPPPVPAPVIREREQADADPLSAIVRFVTEDPDSFRHVAGKVRGLFSAEGPVVPEEPPTTWADFAMEALPHVGPFIGPALGQLVGGLVNRVFPQAPNAQGAASGQPQSAPVQGRPGPATAGGSAQPDQQAAADFVQSLSVKAQLALGTAISELLAALDKNESPDGFGHRLRGQCEGDEELGPVFAGILGVRTEQLLENVRLTPGGAGPAAKSFALDWLGKMRAAFFGEENKAA